MSGEQPSNSAESDHLLGRNEYGVYCVPRESMHRPAAQRILAGDVWERSTLEYLMKICASMGRLAGKQPWYHPYGLVKQ